MTKQAEHNDLPADKRIKQTICDKLSEIHTLDISGVHVEVHEAVVTLAGVVAHKDEIHMIESIAAGVEGVITVNNMLEVKGSGIAEVLSELGSDIARIISGRDAGQRADESGQKS
jgi:uncharacterized hydantoinase/oxoprolinase family protein